MLESIKEKVYPETSFGGITLSDGTLPYYSRMQALVQPDSVVLDYGCGRGVHASESGKFYADLCSFKGKVKKVIGIDPTNAGLNNANLDEFYQMQNAIIPLPDASVDFCHSDWVIEHVQDIDLLFREVNRVLKPGGCFCFRTPNRFHYSSVGASLVPFQAHYKLRKFLGHFHEEEDVFPTTYPCNTRWTANRLLREHGFKSWVTYHRGPSHLMGLGYRPGQIGKWIEYLSPSFLWHEIHGFARKVE